MTSSKDKYRDFCQNELGLPVFSKDWWLDSVCGECNWDVVIIEKHEKIIASLPYYRDTRLSFKTISMPALTQVMGPYLKYPANQKYEAKLAYEKEIIGKLLQNLPKVDFFLQSIHYNLTNWLPFYWSGYSQTTRYTYVLEDISNVEKVFSNFSHAKRKNIRRARDIVTVSYDLDADSFYETHKQILSRQNSKISYPKEVFLSLFKLGYENGCAKTIAAHDNDGKFHSAIFIVWDTESAYNMISVIEPEFRNSGSASLLIFEAIKYMTGKVKKFDFEGSMIENVENSFRQFGAIQKPYHQISKVNSKLLRFLKCIKNIYRPL